MSSAELIMKVMYVIAPVAILFAVAQAFFALADKPNEWHESVGKMRRKRPDGSWEYREMTEAEHEDWLNSQI